MEVSCPHRSWSTLMDPLDSPEEPEPFSTPPCSQHCWVAGLDQWLGHSLPSAQCLQALPSITEVQAWISGSVTPFPSTVSHFFCLAELLNNFFL